MSIETARRIAEYRRMQSDEELERKARKAGRTGCSRKGRDPVSKEMFDLKWAHAYRGTEWLGEAP